ncbi:MAG: SDR family oxidoreductase [Dehalococcoidia bacterium]
MTAQTVLVTGGAGFIGSHLVDRLVELGHHVVVIDDLSSGRLQNLNKAPHFYHMSICDPDMEEAFQRERPQVVFHLAAQVSVPASVTAPLKDVETNVLGTLGLLENARRCEVEKVIYSSTGGAIYGEPQRLPCDESHPVAPLSPYGLSKYSGEQYLDLYRRLYQMSSTVLRYGNVYGPRQDPHGEAGVVAIFSQAMLQKKQPVIFGTGEQERDFVYVADVVEANILAMEAGDGQVYNIGTGVGTSVNHLFSLLKEVLRYPWKAASGPPRVGDVDKVYLDASKARQELGWEPKVPLAEGLQMTVEHLQAQLATSA